MMHRSRSRVLAWLFAVIVAVSAASFSSSARADALDCLTDAAKVAFDPSTLQDVYEFQTKYGQCNAYLANPTPMFAVTLGLVGAAMATGILPTDAEGCINAIPNAAAKLALAAIDALGLPLSVDQKEKLKSEAPGVAQKAYNDLLDDPQFAPLAAIAGMFNCACAIAAFGEDAAKKFIEAADSCGEVIGDIAAVFVTLGGAVVEGFEGLVHSGGCLITAWFGGCAGSAPGSSDPCYSASCPTGQQCFPPALAAQYPKLTKNPDPKDHKQNCGPCSAVPNGVGIGPGKCGCSGGFVGSYEFNFYGPDQKVLKSCACPAPFSAYYLVASGKWTCACPVGKKLVAGKCDLTCQLDQQATPHSDPSIVLAGQVWSCKGCLPGMTSDGKSPCRLLCGPNEHLVTDLMQDIASQLADWLGKDSSKVGQSCKACAEGTKSDGKGPCIPCADENSLVAGGDCYACKPWQKVQLASIQAGGSKCENICGNGVLVDPNAPPTLSLKPGTPQSVKAVVPGAKGKGGAGSNALATPSTSGLPAAAPSSGEMVAGVPPAGGGTSGDTLAAKPVLVPMCVPCGANAYAKDNKCHDCGPKAVVNYMLAANIDAGRCTPCQERQVAKLIGDVMTCAADCSSVGGGGKGRPSTNYINDPKDTARCIPCEKGSMPNAAHTACITTVSLPHGPDTVKLPPGVPAKRKTEAKDGTVGKVLSCPPRMHPNPSGTGCVPDLDMPGLTPGSGPHPGTRPSGRSGGR